MSAYAVPYPDPAGVRALLAAVVALRSATQPASPVPDRPALVSLPSAVDRTGTALPPHPAEPEQPQWPDEPDSWDLVRAAQGGEVDAFGRLYDRYVDLVFRYAYYRLGDRSLAEDVTSETFLRALRGLSSISYQGRDVGAWFVTIARNLVLDHLKSGRHRYETVIADFRDADRPTDGPEPAVLSALENAELLRCIRKLGAEQQECIVLRFLQGLSVTETAELMGKNEGAIKALQHRAIRRLAALLPEDLR
jgi:RNA polymerase sigma-70 factor (TIGR02952 family)